jgi:hypothetical protein
MPKTPGNDPTEPSQPLPRVTGESRMVAGVRRRRPRSCRSPATNGLGKLGNNRHEVSNLRGGPGWSLKPATTRRRRRLRSKSSSEISTTASARHAMVCQPCVRSPVRVRFARLFRVDRVDGGGVPALARQSAHFRRPAGRGASPHGDRAGYLQGGRVLDRPEVAGTSTGLPS